MAFQKRNKYFNKITYVDAIRFHSKKEAARYVELKREQEEGKISDLRLQVPYKFYHNEKWVCTYNADFVYVRDGKEIVEDSKGALKRIPPYPTKRKMMLVWFGIKILET